MKYLKLTNTEECLKLAECLVGSECYTDIGILDLSLGGYSLDGVHYCPDDCEWESNEFLLFDETHRNFSKHILVPLESIKLNPFKAMQYEIPVVRNDSMKNRGVLQRFKRQYAVEWFTLITEKGAEFIDNAKAFELDLDKIEEFDGAEIINK